MNIVEIAGHLGADPEVRETPSGVKVTSFSVAVNYRKQGGDETIWWRVTLFGDRYDKMISFLKKGSAVIVIGEMKPPRIWKDKSGKDNVQLEVVGEIVKFSPFGKSDRSSQEGAGSAYGNSNFGSGYGQGVSQHGNHQSSQGYGDSSQGYSQSPQQYNHEEESIPF